MKLVVFQNLVFLFCHRMLINNLHLGTDLGKLNSNSSSNNNSRMIYSNNSILTIHNNSIDRYYLHINQNQSKLVILNYGYNSIKPIFSFIRIILAYLKDFCLLNDVSNIKTIEFIVWDFLQRKVWPMCCNVKCIFSYIVTIF